MRFHFYLNSKTGFYFIAKTAEIPIIKVKFDYENKVVHFDKPFYASDNSESDIKAIEDYYKGTKGYNLDKSFN